MNIVARTALTAAAHVADRTLTTLCPMRGAARGHTAAHAFDNPPARKNSR